jgi:spore coat protein CotH
MRLKTIVLLLCLVLAICLGSQSGMAQSAADFFNDAILHDMRLDIFPADWQKLKANFLDNTYYPCNLRWKFQGVYLEVENIGIRSRGTGSRSDIKPGLRVDFNRYESGQTFLGLKSFVLRNNTQDATMVRERLSMLFFQRMGIPASRESHVRLYVNDQFVGLYTIVESVDKDMLKLNFGENDGYLYKYDYALDDLPYRFEYRGSDPALYSPKPFSAETHEKDPDQRCGIPRQNGGLPGSETVHGLRGHRKLPGRAGWHAR